jgi:hypothetical protein
MKKKTSGQKSHATVPLRDLEHEMIGSIFNSLWILRIVLKLQKVEILSRDIIKIMHNQIKMRTDKFLHRAAYKYLSPIFFNS